MLTILAGAAAPLQANDAAGILKRMDEVLFAGQDQKSLITMELTDRHGNQRTRQARVWQKGDDKRLFRFTAPAAEAGIAFLSLPDEVMYIYMPAYGRERRIASHVRNQRFAGTDFTYEDLEASRYSERFSAELTGEDEETYQLSLTPLPGVRSEYSRIIARINKTHGYPETMESYDRGGQKHKIARYAFEHSGDYWYTAEIEMTDLKRDHKTRMVFHEVVFDSGIDNEVFTVRNLTRY